MIQKAFGDDAMSAAQIKVWHKHFKDGRESVERPHWKAFYVLEGLQQAEHLRMLDMDRLQTKISN